MPFELKEPEQELMQSEAESFAASAVQASTRETYQRLAASCVQGQIPEELMEAAGDLLQAGLASGRIRAVYGPHSEMAAVRLFRATPQGRQLNQQVEETNKALQALQEQQIEEISFSLRGPGQYGIRIKTSGCQFTALLGPSGIDVRSLEISL